MLSFPKKTYDIIYADPPWSYRNKKSNGAANNHYPTMSLKDICELPVSKIASEDCVLFMWATYPALQEALKVIEAWGFTYKTIGFQWVKLNKSGEGYFFGLGNWTRANSEACLIAVKGKPKRVNASISQLIVSPLERHSKKPAIVRQKIVDLMGGDLSKVELFARDCSQGWDSWGNEVPEIK